MNQQPHKSLKLVYNVLDTHARKIPTLIKIANLNYDIQESHDKTQTPHILYTPHGQLHKQYEIINYIIMESRQLSRNSAKADQQNKDTQPIQSDTGESSVRQIQVVKNQAVINLQASDSYITAKMYQKLSQLRLSLFPYLKQFYKYLTGHCKTKKTKYESLMNKIKKQIGQLDSDINDHPELFHSQFNFLNIIIACEIFMACKFVFQEKFRKSKYSLFNKYEKISHRKQFIQVHGKSDLCQKQYVPCQFQEDLPNGQKQSTIPNDIVKMSNNILNAQPDSNRNELVYNYFKMTFSNLQSKKQYFPYFWLMFDDLSCQLILIVHNIEDSSPDNGPSRLKMLHRRIMDELDTQIDYGTLGLYQSQKDKKYFIRGVLCFGSKSLQQLQSNLRKGDLIEIKMLKIDPSNQKQRKEVQKLWQHVQQNTSQDQINLAVLMPF